ncbi:MAG: hypothetical protein ACKVQU_04700 [Burkholderiales bacterium]
MTDKSLLVDLLRQNLNPLTDTGRYDWLFLGNPHGTARIWLAYDDATGDIIGSGAAIPRQVFVGGLEVHCTVLADFWIDARHRVLGPALKLQRACLSAVDDGSFALAYDMPRQSMSAVYKRLGIPLNHALVRMTRPLRVDRQISSRIKVQLASHAASLIANGFLWLRDAASMRPLRSDVTLGVLDFGPEFSVLARKLAVQYSLSVARTAEYLNWRFRDHFRHRFELLTSRKNSELLGYVVVLQSAIAIDVVDLLCGDDDSTLRDLMITVIGLARARDKEVVNIVVLESSRLATALRRLGFYPRNRQEFVVYAPKSEALANRIGGGASWSFMAGDEQD